MADDFDPPDDRLGEPAPNRSPFASHRFARLVRSPAARRLSPRRLAGAILLGALSLWGIFLIGSRAALAVTRWVAAQPEHQVAFDQIELIPAPPEYIQSGAAGILASVRQEAKYDATLPILATDLESLRVAFSRNLWIENAGPIRSSYRHLAIDVVYRKPVATILYDHDKRQSVLIDRNGVELPVGSGQVEWVETKARYRVVGETHPLIEIRGLGPALGGRVGLIWRSMSPAVDDDKVIQAARLAAFLAQRAGTKTSRDRPFPDFAEIRFHDEMVDHKRILGFFLRDTGSHWVFWGAGPATSAADDPASSRKWANLGRQIDAKGSLSLKRDTHYLKLDADYPEVRKFGPRG